MEKGKDYVFHDFGEKSRVSLKSDVILVYTGKTAPQLVVNSVIGEGIWDRQLLRLRIREDCLTGQLHLVFNKEHGVTGRKEKKTMKWANKELVVFLKDRLRLEEDRATRLKISENLANSDEFMTYEILGKL